MKKITVTILGLMILIALGSCSARHIRGPLSQDLLFPLGTYTHNVHIQPIMENGKEAREFSFKGIVKIEKDTIRISGLSPFGTTLFKLAEDRRTGKVELVNYIDALKKFESKFMDYYAILKVLLGAPQDFSDKDSLRLVSKSKSGKPEKLETIGLSKNAIFEFKKYDSSGIPEEIQIQHPHFLIDIRVSGYEV